MKSNKKQHFDATLPWPKKGSKSELIISTKQYNPMLSLKEIATNTHCSHQYARRIWAKYQKKYATKWGGPLTPFNVHGWFFWNAVPTSWILNLPIPISSNVNGQRVWKGEKCSIVFHKAGSIYVYPIFMGWDQEARKILSTFWDQEKVTLFMDNLVEHGRKEIAFDTPGVGKKFKITVKGLGTFSTDSTPYPNGTTEYQADLGYERQLHNMQTDLRDIKDSMVLFGQGMNQHMVLIRQMQDLVTSLQSVVNTFLKKGSNE